MTKVDKQWDYDLRFLNFENFRFCQISSDFKTSNFGHRILSDFRNLESQIFSDFIMCYPFSAQINFKGILLNKFVTLRLTFFTFLSQFLRFSISHFVKFLNFRFYDLTFCHILDNWVSDFIRFLKLEVFLTVCKAFLNAEF